MITEGERRYGTPPTPPPSPPGWHRTPDTPWYPGESHPPERCHPKCPQWPFYLGVPL